ncbi:MAG: NUDIX domain-containing protein, partial [Bacteroidota bacterium]
HCTAVRENTVLQLPVKAKKLVKKERYFHYLVLNYPTGETLVEKRTTKDIWQNLYQFPLVETDKMEIELADLTLTKVWNQLIGNQSFALLKSSKPFKQTLTHRYIIGVFWEIQINTPPSKIISPYVRADRKNLSNFAFPKIIDWYLRDNSLYLELF